MIIGSLSNDDGDGNKNGKKSNRFQLGKKTTLHVHHAFLYISLLWFHVLWRTWTQDNDPLFLFLTFEKVANISWIDRDGIHAIKFEAARTLFNWSFRSRSSRYYLSSRIFDTKELRVWDNQNFETGTPMTYARLTLSLDSLYFDIVCV